MGRRIKMAAAVRFLAKSLAEGNLSEISDRFPKRAMVTFAPRRKDARWCGTRCRVAAFRARRSRVRRRPASLC